MKTLAIILKIEHDRFIGKYVEIVKANSTIL